MPSSAAASVDLAKESASPAPVAVEARIAALPAAGDIPDLAGVDGGEFGACAVVDQGAGGSRMREEDEGTNSCHTIGKRFDFAAGRRLPGDQVQGRTFVVDVELTAETLTGPGFVCDFAELAPLGRYLDETFDHRILDDVVEGTPTNAALSAHLTGWFRECLEPKLRARLLRVHVTEDVPMLDEPVGDWRLWFGSAHHLPSLPADHKCHRPHGHSFGAAIDLVGGSEEAREDLLDELVLYVRTELHDRDLNAVLPFEPTSERLAEHLGRWVTAAAGDDVRLVSARVMESRRTWASWSPGGDRR